MLFRSDYSLACGKTPVGSILKLNLFKVFPRLKHVKVQIIRDGSEAASDIDLTEGMDTVKL